MDRTIQQEQARHAFEKSLKSGRRDTGFFSRLAGRDNRLLLLSQVREAVTGGEESYRGVQEIEVRKIVGTQNRGDEFSRDFHPLKTWMSKRWVTIYDLLQQNALHDPIKATEIGGCYFVHDGHHRVSAARALNIEFLSAEVTSEPLPYRLPGGMDRNLLPLLRSKDRFHRQTGVFDVISDGEFYVACPSTWQWLEREICEYNRAWFVRRYDREPDSRAEQVEIWYVNLYRNAIEYIRRNSLAYLFPQKRETDIFVEMIRLWNSFDHPDRIWLGEIYRLFIARQRRKRLFRTALQYGASAVQSLLMSAEEEYRRFTRISQVEELVPAFQPLPKSKGIYRFLYRQLIHQYAPALKREYGRAPYIQELTPRWHREFYAPVAAHARLQGGEVDQSRFYIAFSRRYLRSFLAGSISLEEALQRYGRATRIRG